MKSGSSSPNVSLPTKERSGPLNIHKKLATMNKINAELAGPQQQETGGDESDEDFSFGE